MATDDLFDISQYDEVSDADAPEWLRLARSQRQKIHPGPRLVGDGQCFPSNYASRDRKRMTPEEIARSFASGLPILRAFMRSKRWM